MGGAAQFADATKPQFTVKTEPPGGAENSPSTYPREARQPTRVARSTRTLLAADPPYAPYDASLTRIEAAWMHSKRSF
jgi:hypothetical protein